MNKMSATAITTTATPERSRILFIKAICFLINYRTLGIF